MFERSEMTPSTKKEIKSTRQYQDFSADKQYAKCYKFITNHIKIVIITAHKCMYLLLLLNSLNNHLTSVGRTEELKPWNHEKLSSELTLGVTRLMCSLCTRAWLLFYGLSLKGLGPLYLGGFWHSPMVIREGLTRFQAPSADWKQEAWEDSPWACRTGCGRLRRLIFCAVKTAGRGCRHLGL